MILLKFFPIASPSPPLRALLAAVAMSLALLAVGCTPAPVHPGVMADEGAQQAREALLASHPDWAFRGRVALSAGRNGGSAGIRWQQHGADVDVQLTAPITGQSWRLRSIAGRVTLDGLPGGPREGSDAEAMLLEATGWRIPVASLSAWARAARAPGSSAELEVDAQGRPALLRQNGWRIEYRGWLPGEPPLPQKVFASQGEASVRLVVDAWEP
jgi:outer membrane lipoprotein LolB